MATLNVTLPDSLKHWVEEQAKSAGYADPGDYLRELIRHEQERATKIAAMQERVTEGLNSGLGQRSMTELREAARLLDLRRGIGEYRAGQLRDVAEVLDDLEARHFPPEAARAGG